MNGRPKARRRITPEAARLVVENGIRGYHLARNNAAEQGTGHPALQVAEAERRWRG